MKCTDFRKKANHRVVIQSMSNTGDDYGGESVSWQTQSTVWAAMMPLSGREVFAQDQDQSMVKTKIIIRYQSALKNTATTGAYRVSYDGRIFPVRYVMNVDTNMKDEGKAYQILYCEENAAVEQ
jgi:SPP1 family predicted phage head-tail adaptor